MQLIEVTPEMKNVIVSDKRFGRVLQAWEKVGQHQRTWYLVASEERGWELVPDYALEFTEEEVSLPEGLRVDFEIVDDEENFSRVLVNMNALDREYGSIYGLVTATHPDGRVTRTSLGYAGSGYPWWIVSLDNTEDDFRSVNQSDAWSIYAESGNPDALFDKWRKIVAGSPKFAE